MFPALPFGPITLPTAPFFFLFALYFGLDAAARSGRRLGLHVDDVWNTGLLALLAGVIVARLWNVVQFWYVYAQEPLLVFSLRPSGFAPLPGLIAAVLVGYAWLLRSAVHPLPMLAAFASGSLTAGVFFNVGGYLTGAVTGLASDLPWALPFYGEMQHPAGLYRAAGLTVALVVVFSQLDRTHPQRTLYHALLGWGLVYLAADASVANASLLGPLRLSQLLGLVAALLGCVLLALDKRQPRVQETEPDATLVAPPSADPA